MTDLTTTINCNHELINRVSPAGDDFTSCNKCGGHWCGPATPDDAGEFEARGYRQGVHSPAVRGSTKETLPCS